MIFILIFISISILLVVSYFIIPSKDREVLKDIYAFKTKNLLFSKIKNSKINKLAFIPHPQTNWSLNPFYLNSKNERVHTLEGFRKTNEEDSIMDLCKKSSQKYKIICIGSSSTQCQEMDDFRDTWPAKLNKKLENYNSQVFNFGVGAWTVNQSLMRFINWSKIIKPNLVIFYQAKNELTPFYQGNQKEDYIFNDYQNVLSQYSSIFDLKKYRFYQYIPIINVLIYFLYLKKKLNQFGLLNIYRPSPDPDFKGFKRLKKSNIDTIVFKVDIFFKICQSLDTKVLYIPEIVYDTEYSKILKKDIFPEIKLLTEKYKNVEYYDFYNVISYDKKKFIDKMHFTINGSDIFSELLKNIIIKKFLNEEK